MHIPTVSTAEMNVLPFADALEQSGRSGGYDPQRWLYVPDFYTEYRYILGTRGKRPLICMGVNPSTAAPDALDPTLQSVQRVAKNNGFDSFLMFNVYAQRATRPRDMERACNAALHRANVEAFDYALSLSDAPAVWAAWGNIIEQRDYLRLCLADLIDAAQRRGARWFTAGRRSLRGHPHHPLYLRADSVLEPFDIRAYCADCL